MKHYIYKITCVLTGNFYIGMHSTSNLNDGYFGSGKLLSRSVKKYGKDNHLFEIIEFLPDRNSLKQREKEVVSEELIKDPQCLNLKIGGDGGSERGISRSEETRAKISKSKTGISHSLEHRKHNSQSRLGKKHSDETRAKMSASRIGKKLPKFSEEHLRKLSESRRKRIISEETKRKTSETLKNRNLKGWNLSETSKMNQKNAVKLALQGKPKQQVTCPHCNKVGGKPAMMRFHFDNCKEKECV